MIRIPTQAVYIGALCVTILSGCGAAAEAVSERIVEEGLEQQGIDEVDVYVPDEEATLDIDSDSASLGVSSEAQLPEGWPEFATIPEQVQITSATRVVSGDQVVFTVSFIAEPEHFDAVRDHFLSINEDREISWEYDTEAGGERAAQYSWGASTSTAPTLTLARSDSELTGLFMIVES